MWIDPKRCVGCANCVAVCPMEAISVDHISRRANVDLDECVECQACYRGMSRERLNPTAVRFVRRVAELFRFRFDPEPDVCPTSAITPEELTWPRTVRRAFSDVLVTHESTGILGRGTEEVKTNDVTGRLEAGRAGCLQACVHFDAGETDVAKKMGYLNGVFFCSRAAFMTSIRGP